MLPVSPHVVSGSGNLRVLLQLGQNNWHLARFFHGCEKSLKKNHKNFHLFAYPPLNRSLSLMKKEVPLIIMDFSNLNNELKALCQLRFVTKVGQSKLTLANLG